MIITIRSLIDGKVSTFKLNLERVKELAGKKGDMWVFRNSVELVFRCDVLAITHYI